MPNVYGCTVKARKGTTPDLPPLRDKVLLVADTSPGCGFALQCEGLPTAEGAPA